jgi:protein-S-isoprenylcysteine O-methyltransferase Ste14
MRTALKLVASSIIGLVVLGFILFYPAGTFNYWQAWVFIAIFTIATTVPSLYLARTNPAALQRRMHGGPLAEGRTVQKFIIIGIFLGLFAMMVLSAFDHRFCWSSVPAVVCVIGDVLVVAGLTIGMLVVVQNSYAAAAVRVEEGQKLASRGLYKLVRHPMYAGSLISMVGIPLALGSYWGAAARPWPAGDRPSHPRRGKAAQPGIGRVLRVRAAGALSVTALRVVAPCRDALRYWRGAQPGTYPGPALATIRRSAVRAGPDSRRRQTPGHRHPSADRHPHRR